ncbi:MAG: hypothetical protein H6710_06555 [Myxococcales bacterium]|nr:hypothetical protein [Myxococcales bacterium]MCB9704599.1 hypothetical protein [Myxococcales bacterium]
MSREEAASPAAGEEAALACDPEPEGALARVEDAPCPWALVPEGEGLRLRSRAPGGASLEVIPPEVCAPASRCRYEGVASALGPILLAIVDGPESEVPVDLWLGAALGGERLVFAELWWGPASVIDRTEVGPAHTLAPAICEGRLVLRPEGRLPEAESSPPAELLAQSGVYEVEGDALVRRAPAGDASRCEALDLGLP